MEEVIGEGTEEEAVVLTLSKLRCSCLFRLPYLSCLGYFFVSYISPFFGLCHFYRGVIGFLCFHFHVFLSAYHHINMYP